MADTEIQMQQLESLWLKFQSELERDPDLDMAQFAEKNPEDRTEILSLLPTIQQLYEFAENGVADVEVTRRIDDFEIVRPIGYGGMGTVYEARSKRFRHPVALKVIDDQHITEERVERFAREASAASALHHSNIVPVYEFRSHANQHYFTMRFVDGPNLADVIAWAELRAQKIAPTDRHERLENIRKRIDQNWVEIAKIGCQVARVLAHAHTNGVFHRDIKPGNILVDEAGKIWITDFGIAKIQDAPNMTTHNALGTPRYMSPEQLRGTADERSDIFSLGLVLYELVLMRRIGAEQCKTSTSGGLTPASEVNPNVPKRLARIIQKAIELDPQNRYQSAAELAEDLSQFHTRHERQHSKSRGMMTAVGALLLFAIAGSMMFFRSTPDPPSEIWFETASTQLTINENDSLVGYVGHAGPEKTFSYQIMDSGDSRFFQLGGSDGRLSFIDPPDFESPRDANGDNAYEIEIEVASTPEQKRQFTTCIRVQDLQEAPDVGDTDVNLWVRPLSKENLGTVRVRDDRHYRFSGLQFQVTGGDDRDHFAVMPLYGVPFFRIKPDFDRPRDKDADGVFEFDLTVTDGSFAKTAEFVDDDIQFCDVVPGTEFTKTTHSVVVEGAGELLGVASAGGDRFYQLRDDGVGTAALWLVTPHGEGEHSVRQKLIHDDCGVTRDTIGLATADEKVFFVLAQTKSAGIPTGGTYLLSCTLNENGSFTTQKLSEAAGVPIETCSLSTIDGQTFYYRLRAEADSGEKSNTSFGVATLKASGEFDTVKIEGISPKPPCKGDAFWMKKDGNSRTSTVHYNVRLTK